MRPGLTLLCITRDQAPKLLRMLQSVQGVVDEMVVVDTGSKDLSTGVARMQGARVYEVPWSSFSEAANEGMRHVETEWTLRLDTDEWLPPESGPQIRHLMHNDDAFLYHLIRRDLSDEVHYSECWMVRMWRTDPRLRFLGFMHDHFPDDLLARVAGRRKVFRAPVPLWHDGFVGGNSEAKHRRNIALLRRDVVARPDDLYSQVELAMSMVFLQEEGGLEMLNRLTDRIVDAPSDERPEPYIANLLVTALPHVKRRDLNSERTSRIIEKAWQWFDACPPLLWAIAQAELRRNNLEGIYGALLRLEELSESREYQRDWTFDERILQEQLWETLAGIAATLGQDEVAARNRARVERLAMTRSPDGRCGTSDV